MASNKDNLVSIASSAALITRTVAGITVQASGMAVTVAGAGIVAAGAAIQYAGVRVEGEMNFARRMGAKMDAMFAKAQR